MMRLRNCIFGILMLLLLCGCSSYQDNTSVTFYYPCSVISSGADAVIAGEHRVISSSREDLQYVLSLYLSGPADTTLYSPFPAGVQLKSCRQIESQVEILLSPGLDKLTSLEQTIACTCLAQTVLELTGAETVRIATEQGSLAEGIVLDRDSFLLYDDVLQDPDET